MFNFWDRPSISRFTLDAALETFDAVNGKGRISIVELLQGSKLSPTREAAYNAAALYDSLINGGITSVSAPGDYLIGNSITPPNYSGIFIASGATLKSAPAMQNALIRGGSNVRFNGVPANATGFQILYADSTCPSGRGTFFYDFAAQTVTWTAPGDTPGTPVNVATATFYRISSGTANKALYIVSPVIVAKPNSNRTDVIIVTTNTDGGAKAVTGASVSNILTITEKNHGRFANDTIEIYRPSGTTLWTTAVAISSAYAVRRILQVTDVNTYTVDCKAVDFTSEALNVQGQHHFALFGPGRIDGNITGGNTAYTSNESYTVLTRNLSKVVVKDMFFRDTYRSISPYQASDWFLENITGEGVVVLVQFEGASNHIEYFGMRSSGRVGAPAGDDFMAHTMTDAKINAIFAYTGCPFVDDIQDIYFERLTGYGNHKAGIKVTLANGANIVNFRGIGISGRFASGALQFVDDTAGLTGGGIDGLDIRGIDVIANNVSGQEMANFTMTGNYGSIKLQGRFNSSTNGAGSGIRITPSVANRIQHMNLEIQGKMTQLTVTGTSSSASTDITGCPVGTSTRLAVGQLVTTGPGITYGQEGTGNYYIGSFPDDLTIRLTKAVGAGFGAGTFAIIDGISNSTVVLIFRSLIADFNLSPQNIIFNNVAGGKLLSVITGAGGNEFRIHEGAVIGGGANSYIFERGAAAGTINNINYDNLAMWDTRGLLDENSAQTATLRIGINNVLQHATSTGITANTTTPIVVSNGPWTLTSLGNNVIQDNVNSVTTLNQGPRIETTSPLFLGLGASRTVYGAKQVSSPAFSATPTYRLSQAKTFNVGVLTANMTAITLQDIPPAGEDVVFIFTQDGTGGRVITPAAQMKFPTAAFVTGAAKAANTKTTLNFKSDGTNLILQGANDWF